MPLLRPVVPEVKAMIFVRLQQILTGADQSERFKSLNQKDRQAIFEILQSTLPDLPESWRSAGKDS